MNAWLLAFSPSGLLAAAILYGRWSGNDKAPFLVIGAVLLGLAIAAVVVAGGLLGRDTAPRWWTRCAVAASPILYVGLVVVFARRGWIDSLGWLGFR